MSVPISLETFGTLPGVFGAVSWSCESASDSSIRPPMMVKYVGFKREERAQRLMKTADALALSSSAILHLETEHRPEFRTTEFPVDTLIVHGQKFSLLTSFGHVAALLDNELDYDIKDLSLKISLVSG